MKITYALFLLSVAYLPRSYAQNPQAPAQPAPATKQAPCGPSDSFDKHVKLKTPPKLKAQLTKMLGSARQQDRHRHQPGRSRSHEADQAGRQALPRAFGCAGHSPGKAGRSADREALNRPRARPLALGGGAPVFGKTYATEKQPPRYGAIDPHRQRSAPRARRRRRDAHHRRAWLRQEQLQRQADRHGAAAHADHGRPGAHRQGRGNARTGSPTRKPAEGRRISSSSTPSPAIASIPLYYEFTRPGRGAGDMESIIDFFSTLVSIGKKEAGPRARSLLGTRQRAADAQCHQAARSRGRARFRSRASTASSSRCRRGPANTRRKRWQRESYCAQLIASIKARQETLTPDQWSDLDFATQYIFKKWPAFDERPRSSLEMTWSRHGGQVPVQSLQPPVLQRQMQPSRRSRRRTRGRSSSAIFRCWNTAMRPAG